MEGEEDGRRKRPRPKEGNFFEAGRDNEKINRESEQSNGRRGRTDRGAGGVEGEIKVRSVFLVGRNILGQSKDSLLSH